MIRVDSFVVTGKQPLMRSNPLIGFDDLDSSLECLNQNGLMRIVSRNGVAIGLKLDHAFFADFGTNYTTRRRGAAEGGIGLGSSLR